MLSTFNLLSKHLSLLFAVIKKAASQVADNGENQNNYLHNLFMQNTL